MELLQGSDAVCQAVREELKTDFYPFVDPNDRPERNHRQLSWPHWRPPTMVLPDPLVGSGESLFDFDNDGRLDRVWSRSVASHYMHGSVLFVQSGRSALMFDVTASPTDTTSSVLPCQLGKGRYDMHACPPFSQRGDEAGFFMTGRTDKDFIYFRARYASVAPFRFRGTTFIGVNSMSEDTTDFVAVLQPLPKKQFRPMCLLRRIPPNF